MYNIYIYVKYLEPNPTLVWCVECKPWLDILTHFRGGKILQTKGVLFWVLYVYMRRSWTSQLPPLPKLIPCQQPPPGWLTMFPWKNLGTWYSWWFRNSANQLTGHLICRIPANACNPLIHLFRLIGQCRISEDQQHQGINKKPSSRFLPFVKGPNFTFKDCSVGSVCATAPQLAIRFFRNLTVMKNHPDQMALRYKEQSWVDQLFLQDVWGGHKLNFKQEVEKVLSLPKAST